MTTSKDNSPSRVMKSFGVNVYGQLITIIIQLVGVPILINHWGSNLYGEWLIISAVPTYLSFVDLGLSLSAANDMTAKLAKGEIEETRKVFHSLNAMVSFTTFSIAIIFFFSIRLFPLNDWFNLSLLTVKETRLILLLLSLRVLFRLLDGVNHAGYRSIGQYSTHIFFYYSGLILGQVLLWICALLGMSLVYGAAGMLIVQVVQTAYMRIRLFRMSSELTRGFKYTSFPVLRELISPAFANFTFPIAQSLSIQGMVIVIGTILTPGYVVIFSTLRTMARMVLQFVLAISHAYEPEMARAYGKGEKSTVRSMFISNIRMGFWGALILSSLLFCFGNFILMIWTGGKVQMDRPLFVSLLISGTLNVTWYSSLNFLKAINKHLKASMIYIILALFAVITASVILRTTKQLVSVGSALILMDIMLFSLIFRISKEYLELKFKDLILKIFSIKDFIRDIFTLINTIPFIRKITSKNAI